MNRPASASLPRILTIDRVYEPVAEYLAAGDRIGDGPAATPTSPLDLYLVHLLVEFAGRSVVAADLAAGSTLGASTVALLANPRVRRVFVEQGRWPSPPDGARLHETVARFVEAREPERAGTLRTAADVAAAIDALAAAIAPGEAAVAIVSASEFRDEGGSSATAFLERFPEGTVVVLGVGRPGVDRAVEGILREVRDGDGLEVRFLRDASSSLFEATAAVLARGATADERARRVGELFATNYDFLAILRDSCLYAVERGSRAADEAEAGRIAAATPARFASKIDFEDATHAHRALREENERLARELREARSWVRKGNPLLAPARRVVAFGRRHRDWIAPAGSLRERAARRAIRVGGRLRGG